MITAWQNGKTQAWIADTFKLSVSSIKRYVSRFRQTGSVAPTLQQREQPLIKVEQAQAVQAMVDEQPDATLETHCEAWEKRTGQRVSDSTMSRALQRFDRPRKKTIRAAERDEVARQAWREVAETLSAQRLTVFDESGTHLGMASRYARAPRGERAEARERHNTGKNMTLLAGITLEGRTAPLVVEGAVTTAVMEAYLQQVLLPTLRVGDIVLLDNLSVHHAERVTQLLIQRGCRVLFLPAYSPDFSPIENAFAKLKTRRRRRAQTVDALLEAIAHALDAITPEDAIGYFTNAGLFNLD